MALKEKSKSPLLFTFALVVIFAIFIYTRINAFEFENILKDVNSDFALFTLAAEDIMKGNAFPFFAYGQNYMGPLTSLVMAKVQVVLNLFGIKQAVPGMENVNYLISPLSLVITCALSVWGGILFYSMAIRKVFGTIPALAVALVLSLGGSLLVFTSVKPLGTEMAFFLGGLLIFLGQRLYFDRNKGNQFLFGLALGISWWMNQTTIFVILPIIFALISDSLEFKRFRENIKFKSRLLLKTKDLGLSSIPNLLRYFLLFIHSLATLNFFMGVWISMIGGINEKYYGVKLKISNGFSPMKTSLMVFVFIQFLLWFFNSPKARETLKSLAKKLNYFLIGSICGYGPVVLGKITGLIEPAYKPNIKFVPIKHMTGYWEKLLTDFYPRLLSKDLGGLLPFEDTLNLFFYLILFGLLIPILYFKRKDIADYLRFMPKRYSIESAFWGCALINFIYVLGADRARDQYALRYAILMLPIFPLLLTQIPEFYKSIKIPKAITVSASILLISLMGTFQYFQGVNSISSFYAHPSLRDKIIFLVNQDCDIYLTDYWKTYNYQWLLQGKKEFIVEWGQDRTPKRTKRLKASNKKKCYLNEDYSISKVN